MVISKDDFKKLQDADDVTVYEEGTNPHTVLQFLADNQDKAFRPKEIAEATDVPPSSVRVTLTRLKEKGFVEHTDGYWAVEEYELGTQRAALVSRQSIDPDRYAGYDRDEALEHAEFPPDRQPRDG